MSKSAASVSVSGSNATTTTTTTAPPVGDKPINKVQEILNDLADNNITLSVSNSILQWSHNNNHIGLDYLLNFLWSYRSSNNYKEICKDHIATILETQMDEKKMEMLMDFKDKIRYSPHAKDTFEDLARHISCGKYHPLYPVLLRHIVWTCKRRLYGLTDYNPIFLNFYGPANSGKSQFVKALFSIWPESMKSKADNVNDLFNDNREAFRFASEYVLVLDELTGMSKADVNKLKNIIDAEVVVYRKLGFNSKITARNIATLIGTSNTRLRNTIIADSDVRKYAEIDMHKYADDEVSDKMVTPLIKWNWLELWQSVDENGLSPFHDAETYSKYRDWTTEKCVTETPTVEFIKEYISNHPNKWISSSDLYSRYRNDVVGEKPMGTGKFKELIIKYGFNERRVNNIRGFDVPPVTKCDYFSQADKDETEEF